MSDLRKSTLRVIAESFGREETPSELLDCILDHFRDEVTEIHIRAFDAPYSGFSTGFDVFDLGWVLRESDAS